MVSQKVLLAYCDALEALRVKKEQNHPGVLFAGITRKNTSVFRMRSKHCLHAESFLCEKNRSGVFSETGVFAALEASLCTIQAVQRVISALFKKRLESFPHNAKKHPGEVVLQWVLLSRFTGTQQVMGAINV